MAANGISGKELQQKLDAEMKALREAMRVDFEEHRVNHGAETRYRLARYLLLDELINGDLELEG